MHGDELEFDRVLGDIDSEITCSSPNMKQELLYSNLCIYPLWLLLLTRHDPFLRTRVLLLLLAFRCCSYFIIAIPVQLSYSVAEARRILSTNR